MAWDDDLLPKQIIAAEHVGKHARLLAGPGTGKTLTLTRHLCYLVTEKKIPYDGILAVTFTRAAARELRQRVEKILGEENIPRISTLHSFALRQLLKNSKLISDLPQPLRIADDWEERNIILEDIKSLLDLKSIRKAKSLLNDLSSDWQSLTADESDWGKRFPNPRFIGFWREHRQIYGYTLRSELVYQLKKALEQRGDFELEGEIKHLLVDEYQDLNRCDLAVVHQFAARGVELYVAGDDDQSIYGFRKAHPEGIRRFDRDYKGAKELSLEICKRCDREILDFGLFVASQDPRRIAKTIEPEPGRSGGGVAIIRFPEEKTEADGIGVICHYLIHKKELRPEDILILLRSDYKGKFSEPMRKSIQELDIPVASITEPKSPLDDPDGRALLAFLRLAINQEDSLAWRTILQVWCVGVGHGAISALYEISRSNGWSFAQTVIAANEDNTILPTSIRTRSCNAIKDVLDQVNSLFPDELRGEHGTPEELMNNIRPVISSLVIDAEKYETIMQEFQFTAEAVNALSIETLVRATEVESKDIEQELEHGKINILTMHKAKGLTAEAVIIAAAEDQYIPGRAQGDAIDDERRLLYVSLTRAKHYLFITYCDRRVGPQRYTGRDGGKIARNLTQFLRDSTVTPISNDTFLKKLAKELT